MSDLPTENSNGTQGEDKHPLMATLEAMQRLKAANEVLLENVKTLSDRVEMLEKAFQMAFKNGAKSLEEFLTRMDAEHGSAKSEESSEDRNEEEEAEDENEDDESEDKTED